MARPKGSRSTRRISEYGVQLKEKQLAKQIYGMRERQFRRFYKIASKAENKGEALLFLLERRLDNVIYRLRWANSRAEARQLVNHRHIKVNGEVVNIPSFLIKEKDVIEPVSLEIIQKKQSQPTKGQKSSEEERLISDWLKPVKNELKAEVVRLPEREDAPPEINEDLIVEFYSR